jgi:hypothetical protein
MSKKREISLILRAKNQMQAGLASAGASLKKFGQSAKSIAGFFAKSFLVAGAAVVGFGVKAVKAFSVQESAEKKAASAFAVYGEEVAANTQKVKDFAARIQDETGVADENTIARAAQLKMLGVATDELEDATKATIALQSAGLKGERATRAVAAARAGDYQMLRRYIPALRQTNDAQEQAQIVNAFLEKGYKQQADQLDTVAGRTAALKGRMGDLWEAFGAGIAQSGMLADQIDGIGESVKELTAKVHAWIAAGGMETLFLTANLALINMRENFKVTLAEMEQGWMMFLARIQKIRKPFTRLTDMEFRDENDQMTTVGEAWIEAEHKKRMAQKEAEAARKKAEAAGLRNIEDRLNATQKQAGLEAKVVREIEEQAQVRKQGLSQATKALEKYQQMGHEVEELKLDGIGDKLNAGTSAMQRGAGQAQETAGRVAGGDPLLRESIEIQRSIRDYLRGNLEAV